MDAQVKMIDGVEFKLVENRIIMADSIPFIYSYGEGSSNLDVNYNSEMISIAGNPESLFADDELLQILYKLTDSRTLQKKVNGVLFDFVIVEPTVVIIYVHKKQRGGKFPLIFTFDDKKIFTFRGIPMAFLERDEQFLYMLRLFSDDNLLFSVYEGTYGEV